MNDVQKEEAMPINVLGTLLKGFNARANEAATDHFAIDLINQKVREAEDGVERAKHALAALIVRERTERKTLEALQSRKGALEIRVRAALEAGSESLALEGAEAIAHMENEISTRNTTLDRLGERIQRLRQSVERASRRVADLRQEAVTARAFDLERRSQMKLNRSLSGGSTAIHEAEQLIKRVTDQPDPLMETEVLDSIEQSLSSQSAENALAEGGFGAATRMRAQDVIARLRS
jgi:phage shock protein A